MEIVTVGTGSCTPRLERLGPCTLMTFGGLRIAVDLGLGSLHGLLRAGVAPGALDAVLFTHLHPDHTAELASFLFSANYGEPSRIRPLLLAGGPGFSVYVACLRALHGHWLAARGYALAEREVASGETLALGHAKCLCGPALHLPSSLSFRFEAEGRSAVLSGDTGPCPALEEFARGADLLLLEASLRDRNGDEPRHLTPEEAGTLARRAGAARLVLHHLTASSEGSVALAARAFGGPTLVAADGQRLNV